MKKRILSLLLCLCMAASLLSGLSLSAQAATQLTTAQIETVISWAMSKLGSQSYAYLCQKFVAHAYSQVAPLVSKETAKLAANAWCTHPGDKNPPRGATVYYNWYGRVDGVYANYGHVGIALGDGRVIHAYGNRVNGGLTLPSVEPDPDPIHKDDSASVRNGFFTFKNASSGKYMNVDRGVDQNATPITVCTYDDSTKQ